MADRLCRQGSNERTRIVGRIATSLATVGGVTAVYYRFVPVNPTTVALTYVVVVLLLATTWGIAEATVASVVAVACFNVMRVTLSGQGYEVDDAKNGDSAAT